MIRAAFRRSEGSPRPGRAEALQLRRSRGLGLPLALALLALVALAPAPTSAQGLEVTDDGTESLFPQGIQFRVSAESGGELIEKVRLRYTILPDGTAASAVPKGPLPEFEPATTVSAGLILGGDDFYLAPGTRIDYHWEVEDAAGNTATTPELSIVYEDVRFDWKTVEVIADPDARDTRY